MVWQANELDVNRCPHCKIARPRLVMVWQHRTSAHSGGDKKFWTAYQCASCGGVVLTCATGESPGAIHASYPSTLEVDEAVPERARAFLSQAIDTQHAPSGAIMLAASAVDAMLKAKSYKQGNPYSRIKEAQIAGLITEEMAAWAHEVRLEANEERHDDETADLPDEQEAKRVIEFAIALAQFLFVLPERVKRGREAARASSGARG